MLRNIIKGKDVNVKLAAGERSSRGGGRVTSSLKTESQKSREERLAERAVKGTDLRAGDPETQERGGTKGTWRGGTNVKTRGWKNKS